MFSLFNIQVTWEYLITQEFINWLKIYFKSFKIYHLYKSNKSSS